MSLLFLLRIVLRHDGLHTCVNMMDEGYITLSRRACFERDLFIHHHDAVSPTSSEHRFYETHTNSLFNLQNSRTLHTSLFVAEHPPVRLRSYYRYDILYLTYLPLHIQALSSRLRISLEFLEDHPSVVLR